MCSPNRNTANVGQTHRSAPTGAENNNKKNNYTNYEENIYFTSYVRGKR